MLPSRRARLVVATVVAVALSGVGIGSSSGAEDDPALSPAPVQPTLTKRVDADKSPSGGLARTPAALRRSTGTKLIPVMIKYDYDAAASYTGTVSGLAATSPSVTNRSLRATTAAKTRYLDYVRDREAGITARVEAVAPRLRVTRSYRVVYGGVAALLPGAAVRDVLRVPGVVAVQRDTLQHPLTDSSSRFINATAAYRALHTTANAGAGILLGNIDSGVWPEHPSFADRPGLPAYAGPALPCDFGDNPLTPANDPFVCNDKLVGGAAFLDTYDAALGSDYLYAGTARDAEGHGSHTASTSAGNVVRDVATIGPVVRRINGVAPGAQVMEYRVCGALGCFDSDTTAAVEQSVLDGVDVINYSISGGTDPLTDPTELAFLDAYNADVFVAASAGNDGPTAGTANHVSPWVTSVAASTQRREFSSTLTLTSADGATYTVDGASLTRGAGSAPVVSAADAPYGDALCQSPAPAGTFTGKLVVCERGGNGRVAKGFNVLQGGAVGMILYNPALADVETDNHWLPAVHVADGADLVAFLTAHTGITGRFTAGAARQGRGDVMAAFSSRGPSGAFLKPDITAPGVQILAAMTPTPEDPAGGPPGQYYQAIAGTSMSSPHIAGAAILLRALHPTWTAGQLKSAMMTQAETLVVKEDEATPADPFDMGAGRIDVGAAARAPLTISDSASNFALLTPDPVRTIDLNIPSINAPVMPGRVTTTRTVTNVTGRAMWVRASATASAGTRISLSPRRIRVPAGGTGSFEITIESTAPAGSQQFGTVRLATPRGTAHLPVAFVATQGAVTLDQTCQAPAVGVGTTTTCTVTAANTGAATQFADLTTSTDVRLRVVGATGAPVSGGASPTVSRSATLAGTTPGTPSMAPGTSPGGYVDLAAFGLSPTPIGDEEQQVYDTGQFSFNGRTYSSIAVDSNGYLVAGGSGAASDNVCCALPDGPSPAPPNNVLAPLWTDLNGTDAPGVTVGSLTDGTSSWTVVQWQVNVFGTTDTRRFQVWLGASDDGTAAQDISFTYAAAQPAPTGQPFLVGAENAEGDGDMVATAPDGGDRVITSTDPVPGDTLSYEVTVRGVRRGVGTVHTELDATGTRGTTIADTPVRVRR